jgi:iron(II)-dependent oxidoreductase
MGLGEEIRAARRRTLDLIADLSDEALRVPPGEIVNPLLWEVGHVAWFQERWALRHALGRAPLRADADALFDSIGVAHDDRWDLRLPPRAELVDYARRVAEAVAAADVPRYFALLTLFHEDMHDEAFTYMRQTLGYPPPRLGPTAPESAGPLPGDVEVPGGEFVLGATRDEPFVFDNEKWAHPVRLEPFAIARAPVTQAQFAAFVAEGGYRRDEFWSEAGRRWRRDVGAERPVYWGPEETRRDFDRWVPLEPHRPVINVCWHEAEAYARWAGRRLPTEAEWERAAGPRRFPWGDEPPTPERANMDWRAMGCVDVGALPAGDSPVGCRQMIGNVWEWTATTFGPYPGFEPDPYREYSEPWFGTRKVLRGGSWSTPSRLIRKTWRNFFPPHRRDVWAGFRTCAP